MPYARRNGGNYYYVSVSFASDITHFAVFLPDQRASNRTENSLFMVFIYAIDNAGRVVCCASNRK